MTENEEKGQTKKEGPKIGKWTYFSTSEGKLERVKKTCPRCGSGTYLAEHKDRLACGKCGYTEFKGSKGSPKPQSQETQPQNPPQNPQQEGQQQKPPSENPNPQSQ